MEISTGRCSDVEESSPEWSGLQTTEVTSLYLSVEAMFVDDFKHRVCQVRGGTKMEPQEKTNI